MRSACRTLIFTGDGKGKTTAALGMALRASGHGMRVKIIQFMKADASTGELAAIRNLPEVEIVQTGLGFVPPQSSPKFVQHKEAACAGLQLARECIQSGEFSLVILDEVCGAVALGLLDEQNVVNAVRLASNEMCIVMTGRDATQGLIDIADTVTEMREIKHGMNEGLPAQKGVEF